MNQIPVHGKGHQQTTQPTTNKMALDGKKLGFVGSGMMSQALVKGIINAKVVTPEQVTTSDISDAQLDAMPAGVTTTKDVAVLVKNSDVVVLCVKPNVVPIVLSQMEPMLTPDHLVISIAAGVTLATITSQLSHESPRVIRVMPNTPCLVGEGASGVASGPDATESDVQVAVTLMSAVGTCVTVKEELINAVTGLSGSGPAYGFVTIEALADGGVYAGLPRATALKLAAQTMLGAAKLVLESGKHPGELKDQVCSPGGTTIEGVSVLEKGGVRSSFIQAVKAAAQRAEELGRPE
eukprot:m.17458 g.17458  ORF g.17458 m.17458 type:complete len:294 (-) comp5458_c0_seq1:40-921(-)